MVNYHSWCTYANNQANLTLVIFAQQGGWLQREIFMFQWKTLVHTCGFSILVSSNIWLPFYKLTFPIFPLSPNLVSLTTKTALFLKLWKLNRETWHKLQGNHHNKSDMDNFVSAAMWTTKKVDWNSQGHQQRHSNWKPENSLDCHCLSSLHHLKKMLWA